MQTSRPALVVSIHDVSPLTRERVGAMLADLAALGVGRTSLLVIPNHHHKAPILEDAPFCEWLHGQGARHEIVLHGYFHLRPHVPGEWRGTVTTRFYTAGEGEFYDLSRMEAAQRLEKGREELARAGFQPVGFIAPAWLLGAEAEEAVRAAGFQYTTRLRNFKDLASGREEPSQSLVWSVRAAWRRQASLWWNAHLARRLAEAPLLRVGLHPPDWDYEVIRRQILDLIRTALAGREALTYEGWLARMRALT